MLKRDIIFLALAMFIALPYPGSAQEGLQYGSLIKASGPAVYYYHTDGKRYVFPTEKTYLGWYKDFSSVKTISDQELANILIGGNVTYDPHHVMLKVTTDPRVYEVFEGGVLRHVANESLAKELHGENWAQSIEDLPDAFFMNYTLGEELSDFTQVQNYQIFSISKDIELRGSSPSVVKPTNDYYYDKTTGTIIRRSDNSAFFINPRHTGENTADSIVWHVQGIKDNKLIVWETGLDNSPGICFDPFAENEGSVAKTFFAIDLSDPNNWAGYYPSDLEKKIGQLEIDACTQSI